MGHVSRARAFLADGASVLAANREARRPERAIDGDDRGTTRMVQHFEVGAMAVGQLDGVDGHARDTAREHLARADQHDIGA